jgi:hypothetical protein
MADERPGNGRVLDPRPPFRPAIAKLDGMPLRASWEDLARGYATVVMNEHQHKAAQYAELDDMRAAIITMDGRVESVREAMSKFKDDVKAAVIEALAVSHGLPPMRREADSSHAIDVISDTAADGALAKAKQIQESPGIDLTPETVQGLVKDQVKEALETQREHDRIKKLEGEAALRIQEEESERQLKIVKDKENRDFRRNVAAIVIGAVITVAGGFYTVYLQGKSDNEAQHRAQDSRTIVLPAPPVVVSVPAATQEPLPAVSASAKHR